MRKFIAGDAAKAILSGLLTVFAATQVNFILAWVCFIPLFLVLVKQTPKQAARSGFLFGLSMAIPSFYWMIPGAHRFTGSSVIYGILIFIVCAAILCSYFSLLTFCFSRIRKASTTKTGNILLNGLLAASLFTTFEWLLMMFSQRMPWFEFHSGMALADNLSAIQPAEFFGIHILSFAVVLVNFLLAGFIYKKQWVKLLIPVAVFALYMLAGSVMAISMRNPFIKDDAYVNVAILAQNLPPETKWDDNTGDALVNNMLELDSTATLMKPDIALWSESAIPWTYRKDDDLVNELLRLSKPAAVTHVIGINTDTGSKSVYNSVYGITPDGKLTGRFDKQYLLSFIEEPFAGMIFPFLSSGGDSATPGKGGRIINTPYGKAGIIVCNEATVPSASYDALKQGAQFILNLSNDGWFSNSYLVDLHFYNVRLRAVETRMDIVVNSNDGYSGMVNRRGVIVMKKKSPASFVDVVKAWRMPQKDQTLVVKMPLLFIYLCLGVIALFIITGIISSKKQTVQR
ncbi:MAG: apolipoprotein N-acyltransferase [Mucilaginibacter sp.]